MSENQNRDIWTLLSLGVAAAVVNVEVPLEPLNVQSPTKLREWWHKILRSHGKYSCYGLILALPSDREIVNYLRRRGKELDLISGDKCLVIVLSDITGVESVTDIEQEQWEQVVEEYVSRGYSLKVNQVFGKDFTEFPCLILFRDIRETDFVSIDLRNLSEDNIALLLRAVFSVVANTEGDPLEAIEKHQMREELKKRGISIISGIQNAAGMTFETAMKALVEASLNV